VATTVPFALLRARQDLRGYLWLTVSLAVTTPLLTWVFVVVFREGILGWFMAATGANAFAGLVAAAVVPWRRRVPFSSSALKAALIFCLPLFPHFVSHWALQVADRLVIAGIVSRASLGVYTLAASLAAPILSLVQALNSAFSPSYARAGAQPGLEADLAKIVVIQITAVVGITVAGALLAPSVIDILTPRSYHGAAGIAPWLVLGYGFVGLYFVPMNGAVLGAGRRRFAFVATVTCAALNIVLLVLFVPTNGIYAAAVADAAAYLMLLVLIAIWAHMRPNPVQYHWLPIGRVLVVGIVVYVGAALSAPPAKWGGLAVRLGWIAVFALCVGWSQIRPSIAKIRHPSRSQ
jgi:O-antigen/teichoic acid export membrane protein